MRRVISIVLGGVLFSASSSLAMPVAQAAAVDVTLLTGWSTGGIVEPPTSSDVSISTPGAFVARPMWSGDSQVVQLEDATTYRFEGTFKRAETDAGGAFRGEDRVDFSRTSAVDGSTTIDLTIPSANVEFRVNDANGQPIDDFEIAISIQGSGHNLPTDVLRMFTHEVSIDGVATEQLPIGLRAAPGSGPMGIAIVPGTRDVPFALPEITGPGITVTLQVPATTDVTFETGWAHDAGVEIPQFTEVAIRTLDNRFIGEPRSNTGVVTANLDDQQTYLIDGRFETIEASPIAGWDTADRVYFKRTIAVDGPTTVDLTMPTVDVTFEVLDTAGNPLTNFEIQVIASAGNADGIPAGIDAIFAYEAGTDGTAVERLPLGFGQKPNASPIGQLILPGARIVPFSLPTITAPGQVISMTAPTSVDVTFLTGRLQDGVTESPEFSVVTVFGPQNEFIAEPNGTGNTFVTPLEDLRTYRIEARMDWYEASPIADWDTLDRYYVSRTITAAGPTTVDMRMPTVDVDFEVLGTDGQPLNDFEIQLIATPSNTNGLPAGVTSWFSFEAAIRGTATERLPLGLAEKPNMTPIGRLILPGGQVTNFHPPAITSDGQTITLDLRLLSDTVAPIVTASVSPAPSSWGWNNSPVTVDWTVIDPAPSSGGNFNPTQTVVTAEGPTQVTTGPWCDAANNCSSGSVTVSIDTRPPTAYPPVFKPVGAGGNPFIGVTEVYVGTEINVFSGASDALIGEPVGLPTQSGFAGGEWFVGEDPGLGNANPTGLMAIMGNWVIRPSTSFNVGPTPGTFVFGVRARDRAGNWSETVTGTLTVLPEPDSDGVGSSVENAAPNAGDGNGDGTLDSQQSNVTSLPAPNGSFVTLAAPTDATLNQVSVIDPTPLSPPSALTLPAGLASFEVGGVQTGQDVTLTVFTASTANVTGYAKYQNGVWSILPSDRVQIFSNRVEIRLTDGGIGDDDGIANGVIVDPGGIVIQTAPLDTTPPVVTGTIAPAANAAGWNNSDITITWTTDDPTATTPAPTTVTAEGASQTITSGQACDPSGNCATGTVTVSIDRTAPTVTVSRATDGTLSCTATDTLSGVAGTCTVGTPVETAANTFTATGTAVDTAGNTGTGTLTYTVTPTITDRATVQSWITQLNALSLTGRNATARRNAVNDLRDAADSDNWRPNGRVRSDEAEDVLEAFADAAREIAKITGTPVPAQINTAIATMARRWAADAIATAPARGIRPNRITQARQALAQGDQHLTAGRLPQAIDAYTRAHERATDD